MTATHSETLLPAQPFFSTPQQRLALARQRYFEEGVRPSGLVSEGVIQSWARCLQARRAPHEAVAFNPVTTSRAHSAMARSRLLLDAASNELSQLESTLAGTRCTAILTDPQGVVVHATRTPPRDDQLLMPLASRVGVCLAEDCIGTNAPGVTAHTGQPSVVLGGEHFFGCVQVMHCAAAPIRDVRGQVAGVLDLSSESQPFGFDAAAVVGLYATSIENRLLRAQSQEHIVIHFQTWPSLLGTPMEGLAGIASDGGVAWLNGAAARLLGHPNVNAALRADELFGLELPRLSALTRRPEASPHRLTCGLTVWLQARMQAPDGPRKAFALNAAGGVAGLAANGSGIAGHLPEPPAKATTHAEPRLHEAASLRTAGRQLIEQTLAACGGNVSMAARKLGVSRGLVYRHVKTLRSE
jgi:sigma-54 dependent transcriptional regulator, acetoin dehydrogenase operon transcriptional activator AcoR